jgi:electron transfer flavoprotein beta subunit
MPIFSQAKKKPIEVLTAEEIGIDFSPRNKVVKVEEPSTRKAGVFVESTADLVDKLRNEASVI